MMEIREKIMAALDRNPGRRLSMPEIARAIGFKHKITTVALSKLLKKELVGEPEEGFFARKPQLPEETFSLNPPKPVHSTHPEQSPSFMNLPKPAKSKQPVQFSKLPNPPKPVKNAQLVQSVKPRKRPTRPEPAQQATRPDRGPAMSIVTIDVLVDGGSSNADRFSLVRKLLEEKAVLDAKIKNVRTADPAKLVMRLSLPD